VQEQLGRDARTERAIGRRQLQAPANDNYISP